MVFFHFSPSTSIPLKEHEKKIKFQISNFQTNPSLSHSPPTPPTCGRPRRAKLPPRHRTLAGRGAGSPAGGRIRDRLDVENVENGEYVENVEKSENVENVEKCENVENVENVEKSENVENVEARVVKRGCMLSLAVRHR